MSPNVEALTVGTTVDEAPRDPAASRLMDHAYDGIREYDNPLPGWWKAIFWASIAFAAGYVVYFHVIAPGSTPESHYRAALTAYQETRTRQDPTAGTSEEQFARRADDPATLDRGRAVFASRCASCHGPEGAGMIGPNLTDHFQLHGESRMDIFKTVISGVPGTAMLGWREQLSAAELLDVTTFATTLRGKNLAGKAAQGKPVAAFASRGM